MRNSTHEYSEIRTSGWQDTAFLVILVSIAAVAFTAGFFTGHGVSF